MRKQTLFSIFTFILVALMAVPALTPVQTVSAQDPDPVIIELEGEVQFVGADFIVIDGMVVYANDVFDPATVNITDIVSIEGELQEDGTVLATAFELIEAGAGTGDPEAGEPITVVGVIEQLEPEIMVAGYNIAPRGTFNPSTLNVGDLVMITGTLNNGGDTIHATSLVILVAGDDECETGDDDDDAGDDDDDDAGDDDDDDAGDDAGDDADDDECDDDDDDGEGNGVCANLDHPVTLRLEEAYGISAEQITEWRCDGFGYGQIAKFLALAELEGIDPQEIFDRMAAGEGWGQILKD